MASTTLNSAEMYADLSSLQQLRLQAQTHQQSAITEVAKQFEAVFMQIVLKSMRQASAVLAGEDNAVSSDNEHFYQSLYDNQISLHLSKNNSIGLAEIIAQQLHYNGDNKKDAKKEKAVLMNSALAPTTHALLTQRYPLAATQGQTIDPTTMATMPTSAKEDDGFNSPEDFIKQVWSSAKQVADRLGLDPKILVAQAALESGWGNHMVRNAMGELSYNLFGIKADKSWSKESVSAPTFEFRNGAIKKETADFRKYNSFAESFADYANFLQSNPRYQTALSKTAEPQVYARELQKAGYATDPHYAAKIINILQNSALKNY